MYSDPMQLLREGMSDCHVLGIEWDFPCLLIKAQLAGETHKVVTLRFHNVVNARIDMNFGNLSGPGLTWEVTVTDLEPGSRRVCFDFGGAPEGYIELEFDEVAIDC
jgi:hypothetical protein